MLHKHNAADTEFCSDLNCPLNGVPDDADLSVKVATASGISVTTPAAVNPPPTRKELIQARLGKVPCVYRGGPTGDTRKCLECGRRHRMVPVYQCRLHGECSVDGMVERATHCLRCNDYTITRPRVPSIPILHTMNKPQLWSYGVTTVPSRKDGLLPRTLESLKGAGFGVPTLFVDGCSLEDVIVYRNRFNLTVVPRYPTVRTFGNWILSLWELYLREPNATRYAIFQDDLECVTNLKVYLDAVPYPDRGYLNLLTFPENHTKCPSPDHKGFYLSNQKGKGAVALVFNNDAVRTLLGSPHMINRPLDSRRGWQAVDGGIVTGMNKLGWNEYVHNPSLVRHTGNNQSAMRHGPFPDPPSFPGTDFDALELLKRG